MKIEKMELRNKKSGFMIKPCEFERVNILAAEDTADALMVLENIREMRKFALGLENNYLDNISRLYFSANHHQYLWFAKTTAQEGLKPCPCGQMAARTMVVDEEEIYDENNEIIATRAFAQAALHGEETPEINDGRSLIDIFNMPEIAEIRRAFANIYWRKVTDDAGLAQETANLPHGALLLLDGHELGACCDLSGLREDIQIMAAGNFSGGTVKQIVRKGQALSIK